jgi:hypothetical protein
MTGKQVHGEYTVKHLRPKPECMDKFMPLWEARIAAEAAGDMLTFEKLTERMREFQYEVGETETFANVITTVGKNDILDKYFKGSAYTAAIFMGLKGAGTAVVGDTQASHTSWLEQGGTNAPQYTAPRKTVVMGAAAAGVSVSPAQSFSIITTGGTVAGCFINQGGTSAIDNTTGTLFSAGDFTGGAKVVAPLDTLQVTYQCTAT